MSPVFDQSKIVGATGRTHRLIAIVTNLVRELRGPSASLSTISLSSRLDRDLGIDSLGRTELIMRLEQAFRIRLPINVMAEATTVGDLLTALERSASEPREREAQSVIPEVPYGGPAVMPAAEANTLVEALEWHVARNPDRPQVTVLQDENIVLATMSYSELSEHVDFAKGALALITPVERDKIRSCNLAISTSRPRAASSGK